MSNARNLARLLPNASGRLPDAAMSSGSVLQVVDAGFDSTFSTTSSALVYTGFSGTITPTSATSKILVMFSSGSSSTVAGGFIIVEIRRNNSTVVFNSGMTTGTASGSISANLSFHFSDSPATTEATTYDVYLQRTASTYALIRSPVKLTLMEIAE